MNVMFGFSFFLSKKVPTDLTSRELLLFIGIAGLMYWLGVSWQAFVV